MFFFKSDEMLLSCPDPHIKCQHYGIEPPTASAWTMLFQAFLILQRYFFLQMPFSVHHCLPSILVNLALLQNLDLVMIPLSSLSKP